MKDELNGLKVVVVGGGSGSSAVLEGLKIQTSELTAVVTMFDNGGSSGLLQSEFGYPPFGDLRQCLLGLSEDDESGRPLREAIGFRFRRHSSLNGHSLGNLLLAALTTIGEDLEQAIDEMGRILRITGRVVPVALERADLCAVLGDGRVVRGESNIDLRGERFPGISRVFLDPPVQANVNASKAILDADVVVLGPGDLYTSIIPNLLARGIPQALRDTKATRIYVCNLMTKLGETDHFKASDFVREIIRYLGGPHLDWTLIDTRPIPQEVRDAYHREGAREVESDLEAVQRYVPGVFATGLGNGQVPFKHQPQRVAEAVMSIAHSGRVRMMISEIDGNERQPSPSSADESKAYSQTPTGD